MNSINKIIGLLCFSLLLVFPSGCFFKKTIWVYTSLPKEVITEMMTILPVQVQDADVKWFHASTEAIEAKLKAEQSAGVLKADLVLISDPLWYLEQKPKGLFLPYRSPAAAGLAPQYRDSDDAFATVRISLMLLGYNSEVLSSKDLPERWSDLKHARWGKKISMGNPLEYSTQYIALAGLSKQLGWEYFTELRKHRLLAEGSSLSVSKRILSGERPMGILLLENILRSNNTANPIRMIYPLDGAIPIPSPIAILKSSKSPKIAKKVYDWFFSPQAQVAIVRGGMYSPLPGTGRPEKAKAWEDFQPQMVQWSPELLNELLKNRDQIKAKFSEVVFH